MGYLLRKTTDFLASYGFAVALLFFLFVLTFLGTLEQVDNGLYEVQKKYFNSLFLVHDLFDVIPLPLPGATLVMSLLAVNLLLGGFIRIRKSAATIGVLIIHVGMAMMLLAGLVKLTAAEEGHLTLYEGERSDEYVSYYEWEVAVFDLAQTADVDEFIIPGVDFIDLMGDSVGTFNHSDLPFELRLSHFVGNARAMPKGPMWDSPYPVIEGYAIRELPLEEIAERNVAGIYIETLADDGGEARQGILSGWERFPHAFEAGGKWWGATLRHRTFPMPFTIVLDKFTRDLHPGTGVASRFMSDVTMISPDDERVLEIEMNIPLREGGLVLFQSSWGPPNAVPGQPLFSTFSVVNNPSDHWPLYSLIVTTLGLLVTFGFKLYGYIRKQAKLRESTMLAKSSGAARAAGILLAACCLPGLMSAAAPQESEDFSPERTDPWPAEVLDLAAELTIQSGGRVKPLSTFAAFQLLKMNGRRKVTTPAPVDEKLKPTAWILDCFFFPEDARQYPVFLVEDSGVLVAAGIEGKHRRDRYSYNELAVGRARLMERANALTGKESKDLDSLERQTRALAGNMVAFEDLIGFLDFARERFPVGQGSSLQAVYGGVEELSLSRVLVKTGDLRFQMGTSKDPEDQQAVSDLMRRLEFCINRGEYGLALIAPNPGWSSHPSHEGHDEHAEEEIYLSPTGLIPAVFAADDPSESAALGFLALFEMLIDQRNQPEAFTGTMRGLHGRLKSAAEARGEFSKIPAEVSFYKADYFYNALAIYLLSFVLLAASWLRPGSRWLQRFIWIALLTATGMVAAGITIRCVLQSRPPVTTLYETILFITASTVLVSMVIEVINRQRIALAVASVLGSIGLFLSTKYELKEAVTAGDTMPSLVAVLDTNFWLAVHVTTVTMGYAAGLLAAAMAHVWILGKFFGLRKGDRNFYSGLARTVYGVICFGLLFSLFGTVAGGIWANYSWGRFWGWDPKENGALLICIAELMILHARLGGHIKQFGLCACSILVGLVVSFSWWGVNLLGVGLHSYGFTSGIFLTLAIFFAIEGVVLIMGIGWWLKHRAMKKAQLALASQAG